MSSRQGGFMYSIAEYLAFVALAVAFGGFSFIAVAMVLIIQAGFDATIRSRTQRGIAP